MNKMSMQKAMDVHFYLLLLGAETHTLDEYLTDIRIMNFAE